jgi:Bacterial transglutaminase-like N-terminal region
MRFLNVRHTTAYCYSEPVELGEHRSMFRPDDPLKEFAEHDPVGKGISDATNI